MVAINSFESQLSSIRALVSNNLCYGRINNSMFKPFHLCCNLIVII